MKKILIISLLTLLVFGLTVSAQARMRCGNFSVETGVSSLAVEKFCGEPDAKQIVGSPGRHIAEKWIYGPMDGNYYYILWFKSGVLDGYQEQRDF